MSRTHEILHFVGQRLLWGVQGGAFVFCALQLTGSRAASAPAPVTVRAPDVHVHLAPTAAALAPAPAPVEPPRNDTASSRLECASLGFVDGLHTDRFRGITYIDRATVDRLIEPHNALTRSSRLVPEQSHGRTVGVRLFGIRPDTILGRLGFANGDLLRTINGLDVASPERTLEAYAKLREASVFLVLVERQGVPRLLEFRLC